MGSGKGVDRGARIGMGVEAATAWGAETAPMADEEGAAEIGVPRLGPLTALRTANISDSDMI
jgi:hypothetical protein